MEAASRSARFLEGMEEVPQGDPRVAERQPVFEEEGAGAGGGDALLTLNSVVPHPFPFYCLLPPSVTPHLTPFLLSPLLCQVQRVRRWGSGAKEKPHPSVPPSRNWRQALIEAAGRQPVTQPVGTQPVVILVSALF